MNLKRAVSLLALPIGFALLAKPAMAVGIATPVTVRDTPMIVAQHVGNLPDRHQKDTRRKEAQWQETRREEARRASSRKIWVSDH